MDTRTKLQYFYHKRKRTVILILQVRHVVQFHHGYRPYRCLLCSEGAYTDKRKMMNHLLNVHNIVNDRLNNNKEVRQASYEFQSKPPFNVDPIPKDMYFIA